MRKWDVWQLDQDKSRKETDPTQPNKNDTRPKRYYVVVSSDVHLKAGGDPTCVPVQTVDNGTITCISISRMPSGIEYDSFAWCNTIYTLPRSDFTRRTGHVNKTEMGEIKDGLRDYLDLHES